MSEPIGESLGPNRTPETVADSVAWQKEQLAAMQAAHTARMSEAGVIVTAMDSLRRDTLPVRAVVCFDRLRPIGDTSGIDQTVGVRFTSRVERLGRIVSVNDYVPVVGIDGAGTAHNMGDFTAEQAALILGLGADIDFARNFLPNLMPDGTSIFDPSTAMQKAVAPVGDII